MMLTDPAVIKTLEELLTLNRESERRLYHAAEQSRNRGLKLLLKSYAQQSTGFADALISLLRQAGYETPGDEPATAAFSRGLTDIQATMIVRREDRQQHVLSQALTEEEHALQSYAQAIRQPLPTEVEELLKQQYVALDKMLRQLRLLSNEEDHRLLVRLFNNTNKAERVVYELQEAGFGADQIYSAAVAALPVYWRERKERRRSQREIVLVAAGLGLLVGLALGGLLAFAHRLYFPEVPGILSSTPTGVTVELLGAGAVIGALFGTIFGLLMGRDALEDDAYLTQESIQDGDTLVAVVADSDRESLAERIVGLRHEFEVEPVVS